MIVNVRGASGSGKSWVFRQVIKRVGRDADCGKEGFYLACTPDVFVLGRYGDSNTGGADTFKDLDDVERIIHERSVDAHVLVEGIRVNGVYNRWLDMALARNGREQLDRLRPEMWHVICLDTSYGDCVENVIKRRALVGKKEPLTDNLLHGIADHHKRSIGHRPFLSGAGMHVSVLSSTKAVADIMNVISGPLDPYKSSGGKSRRKRA